jgi:hypothetical protein
MIDRHGRCQQPGQRRQRPREAAEPRADRDRQVHGVRPRQELAQRQQLGELGRGQPALPLHDGAAQHGQRAPERGDARRQESEKQGAAAG